MKPTPLPRSGGEGSKRLAHRGGERYAIQVVLLAALPVGFRSLQSLLWLADVQAARAAGPPASPAAGSPGEPVSGCPPLSDAAPAALAAARPGKGGRQRRRLPRGTGERKRLA